MKKTLLSGIKPTGHIHIGNYLGTVKNWIELQDQYSCYFFIADLHALTIKLEPEKLKKQTFDLAVDLLSLGIDPKKSIFFKQSDVVGHTELTWIFNCLVPVSELERMTQFKDESAKQPDNVNAGLLTYPALQAADILLYLVENVPVGQDQIQHLELSRIIARKFNNRYQNFFPEVKPVLSNTPKVMSLNNPIKKMSKSLGPASYIAIRDDKDTVIKKIKKAVTDEQGVKNLLELYPYFGDKKKHDQMTQEYKAGKLMNAKLKEELTISILDFLEPIQKNIKDYEKNPDKIYKILENGAKEAQKIASKNMLEIKKIVGIK
ncbi:tryptophan--tRNA ligase [Candidatus Parcubacteria bacterium]|nr:MAG: tryptophan--tRNA ligase [Candidatus Parcubacteria bacterium]